MEDKEFIKPFGLFASIVVAVVGVSIFSYPAEVTKAVGTNGWLTTLVGGIISYLAVYAIYKVVKVNGYSEFNIMCESTVGKTLGKLLALIIAAYSIFSISIGMRAFIEVIKMYLLERTPTEFLVLITMLVGIYMVDGGLKSIIKFNEVTFFIMFIPAIIISLFTLNNADLTNMLPITLNTPMEYFDAFKSIAYTFNGFEIAYLIIPFTMHKEKINKTLIKSMSFITLFYIFIVILCLAVFGEKQTVLLLWPTITMMQSINIHGAFVEKWEGVVMTLWVIFYFSTFVNGYYFSSDIVKNVFGFKKIKWAALVIIPVAYLIALYPKNIAEVAYTSNMVTPIFSIFTYIIFPILLFVFSINKKKGGNSSK